MNKGSSERQSSVDSQNLSFAFAPLPNSTHVTSEKRYWYTILMPPPLKADASLMQREVTRRARLIAIIVSVMSILGLLLLIANIIGGQFVLILSTILFIATCLATLLLNRSGYVLIAGIVIATIVDVGFAATFWLIPSFGVSDLPKFDLFIIPILLVASFLPARSLLIFAPANIIFTAIALLLHAHTPEVGHAFTSDLLSILFQPVILYVNVSLISYLWVQSATQAITRADRAEEIIKLQRIISENERHLADQKRDLDEAIKSIEITHQQVANGNLQARVPLTKNTVLWSVIGKLNNLLTRFQSAVLAEDELRRVQHASTLLVELIYQEKMGKHPPVDVRTGTVIDTIILELRASGKL